MSLSAAQLATFDRNLSAVLRHSPQLAQRLCLSVTGDTASLQPDGTTHYHFGRQTWPLALSPTELADAVQVATGQPEVRVFGAGCGDAVAAILAQTQARVTLWERDPWLLRLLLATHDLHGHLWSGRLRLSLGIDILQIAGPGPPVAYHPLLRRRYAPEAHLMARGVGARRALLCAGELFVDDLADALVEQGWSVYTWEIQRLDIAELERIRAGFGAEVAVSVNYTEGLAEACVQHGLPLVCWEIDPATSFLRPLQPPARGSAKAAVFTYRPANVAAFRAAGFGQVQHLPLAANVVRRQPLALTTAEQARYQSPVSFVGASMVDNAQVFAARFVAHHRRLRPHAPAGAAEALMHVVLDAQGQDIRRWLIPALLDQADPRLRADARAAALDDPAMLLGEIAAAEKRLRCVGALAPLGITAWGDPGWSRLDGVRYAGYAGHFHELGRIYCASAVNIDVGRLYQPDIVPMRIFDILAHGGFVIAEHVEGIGSLFAPGELVTWQSLPELYDKTAHYLKHPAEARAIARRGMQRVRADHTIRGRLAQMMSAVGLSMNTVAA